MSSPPPPSTAVTPGRGDDHGRRRACPRSCVHPPSDRPRMAQGTSGRRRLPPAQARRAERRANGADRQASHRHPFWIPGGVPPMRCGTIEARTRPTRLQRRMARDGEEVGVFAEQLRLVADRDHGDQAIGQLARRLPAAATEPVQLGGAARSRRDRRRRGTRGRRASAAADRGRRRRGRQRGSPSRSRRSQPGRPLSQRGAQAAGEPDCPVARRNSTQAELSTRITARRSLRGNESRRGRRPSRFPRPPRTSSRLIGSPTSLRRARSTASRLLRRR